MRNVPLRLTVPPVTLLPGIFSTGNDSPVIIDSSTLADPSRTTPSTFPPHPNTDTTSSLSGTIKASMPDVVKSFPD